MVNWRELFSLLYSLVSSNGNVTITTKTTKKRWHRWEQRQPRPKLIFKIEVQSYVTRMSSSCPWVCSWQWAIPFNIHPKLWGHLTANPLRKRSKCRSLWNKCKVTFWLFINFRSSQYWPSENLQSVLVTSRNFRPMLKIVTFPPTFSENFVERRGV